MRELQFLVKPASSGCDLRCRYCFYADIAAHRAVGNRGIMGPETVDRLLEAAFSSINPNGSVVFAFQGGEPTLAGLPFFEEFAAKVDRRKPSDVSVDYSLQTNGMRIDEDWVAFLKEHDFLVGVSIDGCRTLHDRYRVDASGLGTWDKARDAFQRLDRAGVRTNALCVVTSSSAREPDAVYEGLKELGVRFMQFIPCIDPLEVGEDATALSPTSEEFGSFLCRTFDLWYEDWLKGDYHSVRFFDDLVSMLIGDYDHVACSACGHCGRYFVVEADGSVYPCDFFVLDQWLLGRLGEQSLEEMATNRVATEFLSWGATKPSECATCRWQPICNGGCKNDWIGEPEPRNRYCEGLKRFFAYAEQRLRTVARAEWAARNQNIAIWDSG